ncbi:MAG: PQQ-binding-like beta-propeller repeat protein [Spirochaetia bacterium]
MNRKLLLLLQLTLLCVAGAAAQDSTQFYIDWYTVLGGRCVTNPVSGVSGDIYFLCDDRFLYSITENGSRRWKLYIPGKPREVLTMIVDGNILAGARGGKIVMVNSGGQIVWTFDSAGNQEVLFPVQGTNGEIYSFTESGNITALTPGGYLLWNYDVETAFSCSPVQDSNGRIIIPLENGKMLYLNPDGTITEMLDLKESVTSIIFPVPGAVVAGTQNGEIIFISPGSSEDLEVIRKKISSNPIKQMVWADGVICGAVSDSCFFLDGILEEPVFWKSSAGNITGVAAFSADQFFISTDQGIILVLQKNRNRISTIWEYRTDRPSRLENPTVSAAGPVYLSASNWSVYKVGAPANSGSAWKNFRGDSFLSGRSPEMVSRFVRQDTVPLEYLYLRDLSRSGSEKDKIAVIDYIYKELSVPSFRENRIFYLELLSELYSGFWVLKGSGTGREGDYPNVRGEAAKLLGLIGGKRERKLVLMYTGYEYDGIAKEGILKAFSAFRSDPDYAMLDTVRTYIDIEKVKSQPDNRVARGALSALRGIASYHGSSHAEPVITVLLSIVQNGFSREVRQTALDIIREIQKY